VSGKLHCGQILGLLCWFWHNLRFCCSFLKQQVQSETPNRMLASKGPRPSSRAVFHEPKGSHTGPRIKAQLLHFVTVSDSVAASLRSKCKVEIRTDFCLKWAFGGVRGVCFAVFVTFYDFCCSFLVQRMQSATPNGMLASKGSHSQAGVSNPLWGNIIILF
jgi:hypothetical protein